jgi:hypothetical protein
MSRRSPSSRADRVSTAGVPELRYAFPSSPLGLSRQVEALLVAIKALDSLVIDGPELVTDHDGHPTGAEGRDAQPLLP